MKQLVEVIPPTTICIVLTFKCTAQCINCCFGCNPKNNRYLTFEQIKRYIDLCMNEYSESLKVLVITGGECMLFEDITKSTIKYASSLGLITRIVTNGYWASSYRIAVLKIKELKACGLHEINFSSGIDHQQWIPFKNVRNASVAASRMGFLPVINYETHNHSECDLKLIKLLLKDKILSSLINDNKIKIERGVWMKFENSKVNGNSDKVFLKDQTIKNNNITSAGRCYNLFNTIVINPYGECLACCGLCSEQNPFLRLGNIEKERIKDIYEKSFNDALKLWLYVDGPKSIISKLSSLGIISNLSESIFQSRNHICDLCRYIYQNSQIIKSMRQHYMEIVPEILIKYKLQNIHESKLYKKN